MNKPIRRRRLMLILALGCAMASGFLPGSHAQTVSPTLIPFQGRLTNQQGQPYTNGQYTLTFNIYGTPVGGNTLWTERHEKAGVVNGLINVFLGSIQPITGIDFSTTKYLGITIDADNNPATPDPEMVPRQELIPSFYAKSAEKILYHDAGGVPRQAGWDALFDNGDPVLGHLIAAKIADGGITTAKIANGSITTAQIATGAVTTTQIANATIVSANLSASLQADSVMPPGVVVAYPCAVAPPAGWLLCVGQSVLRSDYPRLFAAIGTFHGAADAAHFNVPDYSGRFLRGADTTGGARDPDANSRFAMAPGGATGNTLGTLENDAFASHVHSLGGDGKGGSYRQNFGLGGGGAGPYIIPADGSQVSTNNTGNTSPTGGSETRPKNASVYFIIKY